MKFLFYTVIIFLLYGCGQSRIKEQQAAEPEDIVPVSKYETLLKKYTRISFDTLQVFPAYETEANGYKFKGVLLDTSEFKLIPENIGSLQYFDDVFACYQFPLDDVRIGLITRTPGEYGPSSIKLLVFDKKKDTITSYMELANIFGDGGDKSEKTAWLFKDEDQKYRSVMWVEQSYDHRMDDVVTDTTVEKWNYYYLFNISKSVDDTASKDKEFILSKFGELMKRRHSVDTDL